jgi:pullulanase/glycogen debranching enzyme
MDQKNKLKSLLINVIQNGIAVILDVVYNHCSGNAPQAEIVLEQFYQISPQLMIPGNVAPLIPTAF